MEGDNARETRRLRRASAMAQYKSLTKELMDKHKDGDLAQVQEKIKEDLAKCAELYPIVRKKLDGTAADSKHLRELMKVCQETSKKINSNTRPFCMRTQIDKMMRSLTDNGHRASRLEFTRYLVENHVSEIIRCAPTFEFFYGAIKCEQQEQKEKVVRNREKIVIKDAVSAKERDIEMDVEQDSTPKEVEFIKEQVDRLIESNPGGVPFFPTIVDPESFTKTVENIFHISFLLKESKVGIVKDESRGPILVGAEQNIQKGRNESILSFTMADYQSWISDMNIRERAFDSRSQE